MKNTRTFFRALCAFAAVAFIGLAAACSDSAAGPWDGAAAGGPGGPGGPGGHGGAGGGGGTGAGGGGGGGTSGGGGDDTAVADITWTAVASTAHITFTFSAAPPAELVLGDITITAGTGATEGWRLRGAGNTRTLDLADTSTGTVSVSIDRTGIASAAQTVTIDYVFPYGVWRGWYEAEDLIVNLEFTADGTFGFFFPNGSGDAGTWTADGDSVTLTSPTITGGATGAFTTFYHPNGHLRLDDLLSESVFFSRPSHLD